MDLRRPVDLSFNSVLSNNVQAKLYGLVFPIREVWPWTLIITRRLHRTPRYNYVTFR